MVTTAAVVTESLQARDVPGLQARTPAAAAEMATLSGAMVSRGRLRGSTRDAITVATSSGLTLRCTGVLASGLVVRDAVALGLRAVLTERLAIGGVLTVKQKVVLRETLRLLAGGSPVATRYALMRAGITLSDTSNLGRGVALLDDLRLSPRAAAAYRAVRSMVDDLELTASLGFQLVATVLVEDGLDFVDGALLQALYRGELQDAVDFILDVVGPAGDVTTWAMNARTNAITEYLNYGFNAFAKGGNGTYLAAGDDGLYELTGPDDDGTPVIADVVSGLADFSGIFLSGIQAADLGVSGGGEFFLRLTAATGQSTTYAVKATSMRTARVNMGKGWRARHFTWELLSTGQDFALLDVTFLPVQHTRRI